MAYQAQKSSIRQSEINRLHETINYFLYKKPEFDEYDVVCNKLNVYSRGSSNALIIWGSILASLGLLLVIIGLVHATEMGDSSSMYDLIVFLVYGGLPFLGGAGMIVGGIFKKRNHANAYAYYQQRYAYLSDSLYRHYIAYTDCPVGPQYTNPDILMVLMDYLQSGRADTIKESINFAINDANQAEINDYLSRIEAHAQAIDTQTRVATIFAAASLFR